MDLKKKKINEPMKLLIDPGKQNLRATSLKDLVVFKSPAPIIQVTLPRI